MPRRQPRRPGRQPLLTSETERRLLDAIRGGTPVTQAAAYAGVSPRTFHRWMARGADEEQRVAEGEPPEDAEAPYWQMWQRVRRARGDVAVRNVALVQKAAQGGYVTKETTRKFRDPETRELVEETDRHYAPPEWRAAKWLLETSFSSDFASATQLEVSGPDGGPVQVEGGSSVTDLAERLHTIAAQHRAELESGEVIDAEVVDG